MAAVAAAAEAEVAAGLELRDVLETLSVLQNLVLRSSIPSLVDVDELRELTCEVDASANCTICLEAHSDTNLPLVLACGHWFHLVCFADYENTVCPICRKDFASELQTCGQCDLRSHLWMCLTCGRHFHKTGHGRARNIDTGQVWNYASDDYEAEAGAYMKETSLLLEQLATEERHSLMQKEYRARSTEVLQLTEACGQLAVDIEQTEGQLARAQAQLEEEESYVELLLSRPLATAATSDTCASVASPSPSPDKKTIKLLVVPHNRDQ
ncbi:uncharacterized protein MONBRDRAFT_6996 [Monosiga brevicollis MX1]|uniref:RING-type domain-containing protein n=1 Tax=Monosiga brevicollis TaxID=81824 RepID=A9UVL1_MONBE|nr:uncharacterized protein MONBRDRAFT_6996 [Monosiga brevicollis MX1]EDQ90602.1 predicted protein [Monosiga brevicollis MX1]|eukprot:XP_001744653.1 hypothetical protein [Monosiga brevicollis MX1]